MNLTTSLFTIPEQISRHIKKAILCGELGLGDRLPSENKLAELFGVSRSTIRDALTLLKREHIIETRKGNQGGHFVVQKVSPALIHNLNKYAFSLFKINSFSLQNLFELSFLIEVPVAGLVAIYRSREDIIRLKKLLNTLNDICLSAHSSYSLFQSVISFHRILTSASHNPLIIEIVDHLYQLSEVLSFQFPISPNQRIPLIKTLHSVYAAVENQNVSNAKVCMSVHLHLLQELTKVQEQNILFGDPI